MAVLHKSCGSRMILTTETLDIFEPAMHNLFDTASIVIDAALDGKL